MKAIGLLFLVCVLVGCATLSVEDRELAKEFDEAISDSDPFLNEEFIHAICVLAGYITLSAEERASLKEFNESDSLTADAIKEIQDFTADAIKSFQDCLSAEDLKFIQRGGLGFDPKRVNKDGVKVDPKHLNTRQKVIVMKIGREMLRGIPLMFL